MSGWVEHVGYPLVAVELLLDMVGEAHRSHIVLRLDLFVDVVDPVDCRDSRDSLSGCLRRAPISASRSHSSQSDRLALLSLVSTIRSFHGR